MLMQETLSKEKIREIIAKRAAKEFKDGDVVTLGIGLPTEVTKYIPEEIDVMFQSENGLLGVGKAADLLKPATAPAFMIRKWHLL